MRASFPRTPRTGITPCVALPASKPPHPLTKTAILPLPAQGGYPIEKDEKPLLP